DTAGGILQLNPVARAQFSINNPNTCVPFIASVANASQYTTKYKWLLNGVLTDTVANPTLRINQPSTPYTITLIADNIYGCKPDTFSISFTSRIKPKATFALNDTLGCTGFLNVVTINQSTNANSYQWDWGDNSVISSLTSPTHLYTFTGRYLITIVASDGVCKDTANTYVTVATKPIVDFSADDTLTCDTARVQFTNLTRNSDRYLWSFSDGTFSTETDPLKNFTPSDLRYTVKLLAGNSAGCKDSLIKPNLILAKVPPASDFLITPAPAISVPDYTFSFNNLTLNSNKYNYQWSLGDGAFASTRDVTHKYADTGNYFVRLIVLDTSTNCPDTTIKIARIDGYPGYLFVPNAFYPNSIRTEFKTFKPMGKGLEDYHLQIFDSWGKLLFETRELDAAGSPAKGWDGTYNGMPVPQDSYAWRITAYFKSGKKWDGMSYSKSGGKAGNTFGTLTLFR
ncbi:MAG: PKD domain-containing protein, partial [Ginsengibacter sp.]